MTEQPISRPEIVHSLSGDVTDVQPAPSTAWQRIYGNGFARKTVILCAIALVWEVYARSLDNPLVFPAFSATVLALIQASATASCRAQPCIRYRCCSKATRPGSASPHF